MEVQLSRIKAEQARLRQMVPAAPPGTTRWASAALPLDAPPGPGAGAGSPSRPGGAPVRAAASAAAAAAPFDGASLFAAQAREAAERAAAGGSGLSAVAALRRRGSGSAAPAAVAAAPRPAMLQPSQAASWGAAQVGDWRGVLGLERYADDFARNEINGRELLDLGGGDLDYLSISVLAHRKAILRGVDQLRAASGLPAAAAGAGGTSPARASAGGEARIPAPVAKVHWSHTAPLGGATSTGAEGGTGADSGANSSLLNGDFDEDAERRAFAAAVQAWRDSGKPKPVVSPTLPPSSSKAAASGGAPTSLAAAMSTGGWSNPADDAPEPAGVLLHGEVDEEAEHLAFQKAVAEWRRSGAAAPVAPASPTRRAAVASSGAGESGPGGGARLSCYNCFALFFVGGGFTPRPQSIEGGAQSVLSLSSKAFCSTACYDLASMAALRREAAAKGAVRSDSAVGASSTGASSSAVSRLRVSGSNGGGDGAAVAACAHDGNSDGDGDAPLDGEYSAAGDSTGSSGGSSTGGASSLYGSAPLSHSPVTGGAAAALAEFAEAAALSAAREVSDAAASRRRAAAAEAEAEAERGRERERERKLREDGVEEHKEASPRRALAAGDDIWSVEFGEYV